MVIELEACAVRVAKEAVTGGPRKTTREGPIWWSDVAREVATVNETMDGHFCKGWVVRARTAKEAAREGWHLRHPIPEGQRPFERYPTGCPGAATRRIQRDCRGLAPRFFLSSGPKVTVSVSKSAGLIPDAFRSDFFKRTLIYMNFMKNHAGVLVL
jgi:hypothetical protein